MEALGLGEAEDRDQGQREVRNPTRAGQAASSKKILCCHSFSCPFSPHHLFLSSEQF